jgi:hypothetical protein
MEKSSLPPVGIYHRLIRAWCALKRRKIRLLAAEDLSADGPAMFAVSHPGGWIPALALAAAMGRQVRCLVAESLVRGPLARFMAHRLEMILYDGKDPIAEAAVREAIDVLGSGGALVVFADAIPAGGHPAKAASTAATLVSREEAQHVGRHVAVYPVHLFLSEPAGRAREILIYVDSALPPPPGPDTGHAEAREVSALAEELESRFQENAFQLRPADLDYFFTDLEEVLRTGLQEEWASRPDWKQDVEGFVLSSSVADCAKQANYLEPARLVALRQHLNDYRRLQRQSALRHLEIEGSDSVMQSRWRRTRLWLEAVLGLPIALYAFLNHLIIGLVLLLAGSLTKESSRNRNVEWTLRGAVVVGFYALQILLVAHWKGRAAAGYYAPTLPISGIYLWRYQALMRRNGGVLLRSLTDSASSARVRRLRQAIVEELDAMLSQSL